MYAGQVAEVGSGRDVVDRPRHPYTKALMETVLVPEPQVRKRRVEGIKGAPPDLRFPPAGCRFHPRCKYAMDVCQREEPPIVGDLHRYAACWWVQQQSEEPVHAE